MLILGTNISLRYLQSWPKILAPLVNMIKEVCENESALLMLFDILFFKNHKNLTFNCRIRI